MNVARPSATPPQRKDFLDDEAYAKATLTYKQRFKHCMAVDFFKNFINSVEIRRNLHDEGRGRIFEADHADRHRKMLHAAHLG